MPTQERTFTITLPWPDKCLSPNARVHWSKKAISTSIARTTATLRTMAVLDELSRYPLTLVVSPKYHACLQLHLDFYPPDRRRRDDDNLLAMFKPYRDGIAAALEIDDSRFISHPRLMPYDPQYKGKGTVLAHITNSPLPPSP